MADRIAALHILVDHEYEVEDLIKKLENVENKVSNVMIFAKIPQEGYKNNDFPKRTQISNHLPEKIRRGVICHDIMVKMDHLRIKLCRRG